jgi:YVTN family beta-propeller protein
MSTNLANPFQILMRGSAMKKFVSIFCLVVCFSPVNLFAFDWKNHDLSHLVVVTNRDANELTIIDMTTDEVIGKQKIALNSQAHMTAFAPDGKKLAIAATANNLVTVLDLNTNETKDITVGSGPEHMDISKDNRWLYVGNIEGGTVSAIDLDQNREVARLKGFHEPHGATIMASGKKVYIPNRGAQLVGVVDASLATSDILVGSLAGLASFERDQAGASMHRERSIPTNGVTNVTLTLDEKFAYIATGDANSVSVLDTATDQIIRTISVGMDPWRAYASPNGKHMIVPNNGDQTVSVIDAHTHTLVATLPGGIDMTGVNFDNEGAKGYVISRGSSQVFIYNFLTLQKTGQLSMGKGARLETASTSPAGTKIYVASSSNNSLYVIDVKSDRVKQIKNVGSFPWGVSIYKGQNYCH